MKLEIVDNLLTTFLAIVFVAGIGLIALIHHYKFNNYVYSYIDLNGNKGIAKVCVVDRGGLICTTESGKIVQVGDYQKVKKDISGEVK